MKQYAIVRQKFIQAPHFYGEEDRPVSVAEWQVIENYGYHSTAIDAIRSYVEEYEPCLKGSSDDVIRRHWPAFKRLHGVKTKVLEKGN